MERYVSMSGAPMHGKRAPAVCAMLAILLGAGLSPALAADAAPAPLTLSMSGDAKSFGNRWSMLIYSEAFKRLRQAFRIEYFPSARRAAQADAQGIGDAGRIIDYGREHPTLVRVEEAIFDLTFALYTGKAGLRIDTLEQLRTSGVSGEYRRGVLFCKTKLDAALPSPAADVSSEILAVKNLSAGLVDVYCEADLVFNEALTAPESSGITNVRKLCDIGALPIYPYLPRSHASLAPRLAATLKAMKAEGLVDAYRRGLEQAAGSGH
ncbi:MAG: hypothetical protein V4582_04080 [Pseudomonadota bacterium]